MTKCDRSEYMRFCRFVQGREQVEAYTPDRLNRIETRFRLQGHEGEWVLKSMEPSAICAETLRAKSERYPSLYPLLEITPA